MVVTQICLEPKRVWSTRSCETPCKKQLQHCRACTTVLQASIELLTMLIDLYVCKRQDMCTGWHACDNVDRFWEPCMRSYKKRQRINIFRFDDLSACTEVESLPFVCVRRSLRLFFTFHIRSRLSCPPEHWESTCPVISSLGRKLDKQAMIHPYSYYMIMLYRISRKKTYSSHFTNWRWLGGTVGNLWPCCNIL